MHRNLMTGCGIKLLQREQDSLILTGRMEEIFKIHSLMAGLEMKNRKSHVMNVTWRIACCVALRCVEKCGKTHIGLFADSFAPERLRK